MRHEIVISRFKEDTSWAEIPKSLGYEVTEYNKFEGSNLLPNVGKESHTYLTHIVNNYDNLADVTVFLQGDPLAHCKKLFMLLDLIKKFNSEFDYLPLSSGLITCDGNGRPHCGQEHLPLGKLYEYIFNKPGPDVFISNPAGQFSVTRGTILRNNREVYEKSLKTLSYSINPIEGFCMERMWPAFFGLQHDISLDKIDYAGDDNIDIKEYISLSRDVRGNLIKLGTFGFNKLI